jgi:hypothetical protein
MFFRFKIYYTSIMLLHLINNKRFDLVEKIEMRYNEQSTLDLIIKDTKKWNF